MAEGASNCPHSFSVCFPPSLPSCKLACDRREIELITLFFYILSTWLMLFSLCWSHCCNNLICEAGRGHTGRAKRTVLELSSVLFYWLPALFCSTYGCSLLEQMFWWGQEGLLRCSEDTPLCSPPQRRIRKIRSSGALAADSNCPCNKKRICGVPSSLLSSHLCGCECRWL